ncbi:MAG: hypothetical protein R3A51_02440 [Nannocystaceae bacterium]
MEGFPSERSQRGFADEERSGSPSERSQRGFVDDDALGFPSERSSLAIEDDGPRLEGLEEIDEPWGVGEAREPQLGADRAAAAGDAPGAAAVEEDAPRDMFFDAPPEPLVSATERAASELAAEPAIAPTPEEGAATSRPAERSGRSAIQPISLKPMPVRHPSSPILPLTASRTEAAVRKAVADDARKAATEQAKPASQPSKQKSAQTRIVAREVGASVSQPGRVVLIIGVIVFFSVAGWFGLRRVNTPEPKPPPPRELTELPVIPDEPTPTPTPTPTPKPEEALSPTPRISLPPEYTSVPADAGTRAHIDPEEIKNRLDRITQHLLTGCSHAKPRDAGPVTVILGVEVDESGTVGVIPRNDAARTPLGACTITLVQQLRFPKARERASRVHLIKYP